MIPLSLPLGNNPSNYKLKCLVCLVVLIAFFVYSGILFIYNNDNDQYLNQSSQANNNTSLLNKHLYSIKGNDRSLYSKLSLSQNYIGTWNRLQSDNSTSSSSITISGNAKIIFNLDLISNEEYQFKAKFLIYENSKAFINTFQFSSPNFNITNPNSYSSLTIVEDNHSIDYLFKGDIVSLINDKQYFTNKTTNCLGYLSLTINTLNNTMKGNLTTGNCSINLQYEVEIEDQTAKERNISLYITIVSLISICSIISKLAYAIQIEGNIQRSNSLSLFSVALNMIWTVYNIYSNFFLLYINIGYFYQFLLPMILFLFHFGCDMKVWILSIETKYNDTRYISFLTFITLTISFCSYFLGLGIYFEKCYTIMHMALIWFPQIIYNVVYFNDSLFPISYMIVETIYRAFIPLYFCSKEINFVTLDNERSLNTTLYMGIAFSSFIVLLSQYAFGSRWFIPFRAYREKSETLYKKKSEMARLLPSANSIQCAICLNELFNDKRVLLIEDFDYGNKYRKKINCSKVRSMNENDSNNKRNYGNTINQLFSFLFCFNKRSNIQKRDYMLTQCNHAFHSGCLELWLEFKKDCPNCRRQILK